jgi:predicted O-methyltransferase YrrM
MMRDHATRIQRAPDGLLLLTYGSDFLVVTGAGRCTAASAAAVAALEEIGPEGVTFGQLAEEISHRVSSRHAFIEAMESIRALVDAGGLRQIGVDGNDRDTSAITQHPDAVHPAAQTPLVASDLRLPMSGHAASATTIAAIVSEVLTSPGRRLLEFGPGLSTIAVGHAANFAGLDVDVVAVEQGEDWAMAVTEAFPESTHAKLSIVVAPLVPFDSSETPFTVQRWYDRELLTGFTGQFDVLVVDGPTAFKPEWAFDRWPALNFSLPLLASGASIILDDVNRGGEDAIGRQWFEQLGPKWRASHVDRSLLLQSR